jgi:5-formyltetrahydrofolate cyclo-ligase
MTARISKADIRHRALEIRDGLSDAERAIKSEAICRHLFAYIEQHAKGAQILSYIAFRQELDLKPLHEWLWAAGYRIAIPRVNKQAKQLDWRMLYRYDDLEPGYAGIMEPSLQLIPWHHDESQQVVLLLPGVAFDRHGGRVGYGGGYYDRFAADKRWVAANQQQVCKIAPAFSNTVFANVPMAIHDVVVDILVTENGPLERMGTK